MLTAVPHRSIPSPLDRADLRWEITRRFEGSLFTISSVIDFQKIWIEQCEAAEGIKERFGVDDAARYLIGEKLFRFMQVSQDRPDFAEELPAFVAEIKRIFAPHEISEFFDDLQAGRVTDPAKLFSPEEFDEGELDEHEVLNDADQILIIENAKRLLLS
jgi:hypothetical protein